jgi:RNA polymerase sigma-70 factor (ECF subfamily)
MRGWRREPDHGWNWREALSTCSRLARRYASEADADDVAQEAVLRAWRFRTELRRGDRLEPWLATIVRNEAARQRGKPRPEPVAEMDAAHGAEDENILAVTDRADLKDAMSRLDDSERAMLHLRYGRDLTQLAIARTLNLPEGTVKVGLHRARAKLYRTLSET